MQIVYICLVCLMQKGWVTATGEDQVEQTYNIFLLFCTSHGVVCIQSGRNVIGQNTLATHTHFTRLGTITGT